MQVEWTTPSNGGWYTFPKEDNDSFPKYVKFRICLNSQGELS